MKAESKSGMIFNIQKFSINDGPGIRTVVFFKGCPLKCTWCANPESQDRGQRAEGSFAGQRAEGQGKSEGRVKAEGQGPSNSAIDIGQRSKLEGEVKTVEEIMRVVMQDLPFYEESGGGVTLSGGEATMQPEFAIELLKALKSENIHTAIETTGFTSPTIFQSIIEYLDLLLFDIKHWDEAKHKEGTGVSNVPILKNMKYAIEVGKEVLPRLPVIPGYNDSLDDARGFVRRLREVGAERVQLLPFHQFGENKYHQLGREYAFSGVKALHPEDLQDFRQVFIDSAIEAFF